MEQVDLIMSSVLLFNYYAALVWWEARIVCCAIPDYLDLNLFSGQPLLIPLRHLLNVLVEIGKLDHKVRLGIHIELLARASYQCYSSSYAPITFGKLLENIK